MSDIENSVDTILEKLANWNCKILRTSLWQIGIFILLSLYNFAAVWFMYIHYFTSDVNYLCNIPANVSKEDAIPTVNNAGKVFEKCYVYKDFNKSSGIKIPCPMGYNHSPVDPSHSIVADFNLYCSREYLVTTSESIFYVGVFVGSLSFTVISERLGRRPIFLASFWLAIVVGFSTFFSKNFGLFCFLRFCAGMLYQGYGVMGYILGVELYAAQDRAIPCIFMNLFWGFGMMILGLFAYLIPKWRYLYLAITVPLFLTIPYYWLVDESLYWLVSKGRYDAANKIIQRACKINRMEYNDQLMLAPIRAIETSNRKNESGKVRHILHKIILFSKRLLNATSYLYYLLAVMLFLTLNTFVYNGLTLSANVFSNNIYINWIITSLLEFPVIIFIGLVVDRCGRKYPCAIFHLLLGILLLAFSFMQNSTGGAALSAVNHLSKFFTTITYSIVWLYGPELFPTESRSFSVGLTSSIGKLASIFSPTFYTLMLDHRRTTMLLLASLCFLSFLVSLFLPETSDQNLAEKIEDVPRLSLPTCKNLKCLN